MDKAPPPGPSAQRVFVSDLHPPPHDFATVWGYIEGGYHGVLRCRRHLTGNG